MKYEHISPKPYCCVPACIQMVLRRRRLPRPPAQGEIAYELGVVLPSKDRHLLPRSYKSSRPKAGWGTRIDIKGYSLTAFFKHWNYALKEKYHRVTDFPSEKKLRVFLKKNLKLNNDMLVCYSFPALYHLKGKVGHASLIEGVHGKYIILRDPSAEDRLAIRVLLSDLMTSMRGHYKGGVWVISEKK